MSLESSIRESGAALGSTRASDRKKNGESLKSFLLGNAAPALLSANTLQNKGYTWNHVFDDINDLVIKETEKYESSKTFETISGPLCANLLQLCVSGSIKGKAYITCDRVMNACLLILRDKRLLKAVGDTYLNLLYKYVLTSEYYVMNITPLAWHELFDTCIEICTSKHSKLDSYTKLRLLLLVMKNAIEFCQFVIPLRDSLPRLSQCFLEIASEKKVKHVIIDIMMLLLQTLSADCRFTMCEFTEGLSSLTIKLYDESQIIDHKRKASLFDLLLHVVYLHHPLGRTKQESGCQFHNWEHWNKYLHSMLDIVCLEVSYLQKQRKHPENVSNQSLYNLAASVYYQIFNSQVKNNTEDGETSTKRQRMSYNTNNSFFDLIEEMRQNHIPWLPILNAYVTNFGASISTNEYRALLMTAETLVTNSAHLNNFEASALKEIVCLVLTNLESRAACGNDGADGVVSLWNSCVRISTVVNSFHSSVHSILQRLLILEVLNYENVQPLLKLYHEKGMPVTESSLSTLNYIFYKIFSKTCHKDARMKCFNWLVQGQIPVSEIKYTRELLLRLLVNENVELDASKIVKVANENLHDLLFNSMEKSILFSQFDLDLSEPQVANKPDVQQFELNAELDDIIKKYFISKLTEEIRQLNDKEIKLLEFMAFIKVILCYFDLILKNNLGDSHKIQRDNLYRLLKKGIQTMYSVLTFSLKNNTDIGEQIKLLQGLQDILKYDYDDLLNSEVRQAPTEFFVCLNVIVNKKIASEECIVYEEDNSMLDPQGLRRACICTLAGYCRKRTVGRTEILNFILDPEIYDFTTSWDREYAFDCLEILNGPGIEEPKLVLASSFILMQGMCRVLFKNSQATYKLLKVFLEVMDQIWTLEKERQNCLIMVRGYLHRCENKYYPPRVAALIYECVAKMTALSLKQNDDTANSLKQVLQDEVKGEIHRNRLYCSYLLKHTVSYLSNGEISNFLDSLSEIFVINVTDRRETVLKDETFNRTLTVLHTALALVQVKSSMMQDVIVQLVQTQKEKSLDKALIKKVLNMITKTLADKDVETFFNENVLFVLNFWFLKGNSLDSLPLYLFGCKDLQNFLQLHYKWAVSADILWNAGGVVTNSTIFNMVQVQFKKSAETILELCINNMVALYLPYTVINKYGLGWRPAGKEEWLQSAERVFRSSAELVGTKKWSSLFTDNLGELFVLAATHYADRVAAAAQYQLDIPPLTKTYLYPKVVFDAILSDLTNFIEEDILKYLCENKALTVFITLFQLWANVLCEKILEYKVLSLHTYVSFLEMIPLNCPSDAFVANFACTSLAQAIKEASKDQVRVYSKALKMVLSKFIPERVQIVRKPVSQLLSILMVKKDEGFEAECAPLLTYLTSDVKDYLKEENLMISSLSQGGSGVFTCSSMSVFLENLQTYKNNLSCPSHETLTNLHDFLRRNKHFTTRLCNDLNTKGFSDDCGTSAIHQAISTLSNVLKSATDDKTIIEACNCFAEIGNYDLKTLVTVPPVSTQRITNVQPRQYFAIVVMSTLTEVLFDKDPLVTSAVTKTLKRMFQYRDGKLALELEENKEILIPLSSSNCSLWADFVINESKFKSLLCAREFWVPKGAEGHREWLARVTFAILEVLASTSNYLNTLQAVCKLKPDICQKILPALLGVLLECCSVEYVTTLAETTNKYFLHMWSLYHQDNTTESSDDSESRRKTVIDRENKRIMEDMLNIVDFVRLQRGHYKIRPEESLNYLRLEYDKVAWVATVADQSVSAIYYGELWAQAQNDGVPPAAPDALALMDGGDHVHRIFRKCFVSIGEMDAIDGCGTAHLTIEDEKRKHLFNTGQYTDALLLHDIALSCSPHAPLDDPRLRLRRGVVKCLHKSGMHHLALQYIKSLPESDDLDAIKYECLSLLGDWSDFVDTRKMEKKCEEADSDPSSIIKALRYSCLKDCLNVQPTPDFRNKLTLPLNRAKRAVAKLCQSLNMENCQNVYRVLSMLHRFGDIGDYFSVRSDLVPIQDLLKDWQVQNLPAFNDFKHLESLITQRSLMLEHAAKTYRESLKDIVSLQLSYAELSLSNERIQMAQRLLAVVKKVQNSPEVSLAESRISWAKGHKDIALSLLRNVVTNPPPDVRLAADSLRNYGIWMAESKRDNARDIINKYLKKSLDVLSDSDHEETRLKVYYDIAKFADAEYKQVVAYMNSSVFEKKVKCLETIRSSALNTQTPMSRDEKKACQVRDKFGHLEEAEIANTKAERNTFLQEALRYYLLSLKQSERNNLSVFRVISLWLDSVSGALPPAADCCRLLHEIPSCKFVAVLPQLAPRLTLDSNTFADDLRKLLKRCAIEHPHHTLPILFNMKNSDKDMVILNESERVARGTGASGTQRAVEPRVAAATHLVAELAELDILAPIVKEMEQLCDATISLANYDPKTKTPNQKLKIPAAEKIHRIGPLAHIPIPTVTIPVKVDCKYTHLPTIHTFENYFETVGGVNCPKKINCKGSDGRTRILLIKGEDDLRQDAVMQQVFNIVNTLLENDPVTSRSKLLIRTYKVVPMSKKSGVLEWCEGTMPIGFWLTEAHPRYRPKDMSPSVARQHVSACAGKSPRDKLAVFTRIARHLRPVMHYFFTERYHHPLVWYERRLAYTKSVASSSMIGYILGLGDRHVQNILIDKQTAEVVHIDFGIAFDQAKTLPTPETVPFRLTQDIVAGFGCSGVEGIFRKSCEKTMQLLRDNQETLLTILEVLLCDPLYSWTIVSKQQNVSTSSGNPESGSDSSLARRALLSVSSKLSGAEGGAAGGVAVPGQVARLLHTAADPNNLSKLFHGWQAYL